MMVSSTNQRHADELREALHAFRQAELSVSSVEALTARVERVAERLAPRLTVVTNRKVARR